MKYGRFTIKQLLESCNLSVLIRLENKQDFDTVMKAVQKTGRTKLPAPKKYPCYWFSINKIVDPVWVLQHSFEVVHMDDIEWNLEKDIYTLINEGVRTLSPNQQMEILNCINNMTTEEISSQITCVICSKNTHLTFLQSLYSTFRVADPTCHYYFNWINDTIPSANISYYKNQLNNIKCGVESRIKNGETIKSISIYIPAFDHLISLHEIDEWKQHLNDFISNMTVITKIYI